MEIFSIFYLWVRISIYLNISFSTKPYLLNNLWRPIISTLLSLYFKKVTICFLGNYAFLFFYHCLFLLFSAIFFKKRIYGSEYLLYFLPPFGFISGGIGTGTFVEIIVLVGIYGIRCQSVKVKVSNSLWHFIREGWLLTVSLKEGLFSWKL